MRSDSRTLRFLPSRYWIRCLLVAGLVVACDPYGAPWGTCGDDAHCGEYDYRIEARYVGPPPSYVSTPVTVDSLGVARVDSLPVGFSLEPVFPRAAAAVPCPGRRGLAYAMSCAGCESAFVPDSIRLTTDYYSLQGDTLKAGVRLEKNDLPPGIAFTGTHWFHINGGHFRDSAFEVRFDGRIGKTPKSAVLKVVVGARLMTP